MRIHKLEIKNFRGIKSFSHDFGNDNLICLVGRGNSTKSTILDAIALSLTPKWTLPFIDSDFFCSDITNDIDIYVTISDIPDKLIDESKFGLYLRQYDSSTQDFAESDNPASNLITTITLNLNVDSSLEPEWKVISDNLESKSISARNRATLGAFLISDFTDNHLSLNRGSPLLRIQNNNFDDKDETKNFLLEALREVQMKIGEQEFSQFQNLVDTVIDSVKSVGGDIDNSKATLDIKDMSFKNNAFSLHNNNNVPIRMDGKGSKRLISIAIQLLLGEKGCPILIDEAEQGLEPDRVKHLIRTLECNHGSQIFLTTHSREIIEEVQEPSQIFIVNNEKGAISCSNNSSEKFKKLYRACPEAVYATKAIVCEGKTEVGLLRSYDNWRISNGKKAYLH